MTKFMYHRDGCKFSFAPLDVCNCVAENMADRIAELEVQLAQKDKLYLLVAGDKINLRAELDSVKAQLASARDDALEEAARLCDDEKECLPSNCTCRYGKSKGEMCSRATARNAAFAIRALKGSSE